mgnify:CR=1 FL=1
MRSMRTNGASKNRDSCCYFSASKLFSIGSFCMFLFISVSFCFFLYVYLRHVYLRHSDRPNVRFGRTVRPNFYCAVRPRWQNFFLQNTELFSRQPFILMTHIYAAFIVWILSSKGPKKFLILILIFIVTVHVFQQHVFVI